MDIVARLLVALGVCALGVGLYRAWNRWQLLRLRQVNLPGLENFRRGVAGVLYFTTPDCVPCRTTQRPALARLQAELAERVQVIEVDAGVQPGVADYWGVLSVPTTFVIDAAGRPRRVNHGVASAEKLKKQLEEVDTSPSVQGEFLLAP